MTLSLLAYTNQRFQVTFDVLRFASLYPSLASASWRMQVRPFAGSPIIALDFQSSGSLQSASLTATYNANAQKVTFRAPAIVVFQSVPAGQYAFDYGFVLAGADFERVDGGTITFNAGVTQAGVISTPSPPPGADDTVVLSTG